MGPGLFRFDSFYLICFSSLSNGGGTSRIITSYVLSALHLSFTSALTGKPICLKQTKVTFIEVDPAFYFLILPAIVSCHDVLAK